MARILIVDDDRDFCRMLARLMKRLGHESSAAFSQEGAREKKSDNPFDVVFLDVRLPDGSGLELIPDIRNWAGEPDVIILTGMGDHDGAETAIKSGAWTYLEKTASVNDISLNLSRVLEFRKGKAAFIPKVALWREGIVGQSSHIKACLDRVAQAANGDVNVLITGESGTGKELFALAVHKNSPRADKNFIVVDCTTLPNTLVESLLFGHEKGAFTSADKAREGLIEQSDGGTLFLDEIGDLPLPIQKTFLRVLQERRFRPVGSNKERETDFRLVAATNRNLDLLVQERLFRQDLLFRLRSVTIDLPPLKEHPEDIKELTMHYLSKICDCSGAETKGISPDFHDALAAYDWPGNIRELIKILEAAIVSAGPAPTLFSWHLPANVRVQMTLKGIDVKGKESPRGVKNTFPVEDLSPFREYRESAMAEVEKRYLEQLVSVTKGNMKEARRISGLSTSWFYSLLKKYGIQSR